MHFWRWQAWVFLKIPSLLPEISMMTMTDLHFHVKFSMTHGKITWHTNLSTVPAHQHLWQGYSAPLCVTKTLKACNKYCTFPRTNLAPTNLMDTGILHHTFARIKYQTFLSVGTSRHHCNHLSGTICSKQARQLIIYQEQSRPFGEGCNCIRVGVILLSQKGHSVYFKATWGKEEWKQALQGEITSNSQIYHIFFPPSSVLLGLLKSEGYSGRTTRTFTRL